MPRIEWRPPIPWCDWLYNAAWGELFRRRAASVGRRACPPEEVALIYGYEVLGVPPARQLADMYGRPLITRFQGTILAPWLHRFGWRVRHFNHFRGLRCPADAVVMTNDGTQGDRVLEKLGVIGAHVHFWMNGVERLHPPNNGQVADLRSRLGLAPGDLVLLTVSRLEHWKRVDRAIAAMPRIAAAMPNCHLVVVGDGGARGALEKQSRDLGLSHRVHFVGAIERAHLGAYYFMADLFLSLYDLSNLGNPLLEAMSAGLCVVTLDVGDTSTAVRNDINGVLLDPEDLASLPDIIVRLLRDAPRRRRLADAAKAYGREHFWTWEERMRAEMTLVENLMGKCDGD